MKSAPSRTTRGWLLAFVVCALALLCHAQSARAQSAVFGPYHGTFLQGGEGLAEALDAGNPILGSTAPWSMYGWVRTEELPAATTLLFGFGEPGTDDARYVGLRNGAPALWIGTRDPLQAVPALRLQTWHFVAATFDGHTQRLYLDGRDVASQAIPMSVAHPIVRVAPVPAAPAVHFGGQIAAFTLMPGALTERELRASFARPPDFALIPFAKVSVGWPVQTRAQFGLAVPQPPATLPKSHAPVSRPVATPPPPFSSDLTSLAPDLWAVSGWRLADAREVTAAPRIISSAGFEAGHWHVATVPGTVLTTLIDRGVFPDPDQGLNNLAIPESLNQHDYWYRTQFVAPGSLAGRRLTLTFNGINYAAEVWLNGEPLGTVRGAFIRGAFDVTQKVIAGKPNVLAVRISPPPHPGIPHEQSILAGPGENGGMLALDGPTFIATEGWDWIPGIRDRNIGLWQDVVLRATSSVSIGDPQVVTRLPLPATNRADIEIDVPLENASATPISGVLTASFDRVKVQKTVTLPAGSTDVRLSSEEFKQLVVENPRLWWPNGYGTQELYDLELTFTAGTERSDQKSLRFGVRHITYELSLFDPQGHLRRVLVDPTLARERHERVVDVRHEAIKKSPRGWAASLYPGALESPAVTLLDDDSLTPHLALRVNGVRIAARGGNWGMDDSRKRVSRARLEPYFRLHRDANLNIIRNWVGQNTEEVFYELADEYGMLVLNDFWASTQDFQLEPEDTALFLDNARDTISRYRNHPSIVMWFGRNEGVPQPVLNSGLADLVAKLDGTRYFTGSSNRVNLAGSGPYNYRPAVQYFTEHAQGFSVEVGVPSLSTLESIQAWTAPEDRWPISDVLAYHDWHQGGNGDTATFMRALETQFGAATSLEDFERKAQMMNYVTHRALFEGFNAQLWTRNSGRLLWMTHPAWPSQSWQIYSSDYDTQASFFGVKKACEVVHVQMNLPDFGLAIVNTMTRALPALVVRARTFALDNRLLDEKRWSVSALANATTNVGALDLQRHLMAERAVLVKLELTDERGQLVSENFYWQARDEASLRALNELPAADVRLTAVAERAGNESRIRVALTNKSHAPALATKLTLLDSRGQRILPAYYSDNYVSLLPGETREIEISVPRDTAGEMHLALRGWNVKPAQASVTSARPRTGTHGPG
jgi:beta-galactosidase/beta-glucuronidase